MSLVIFCISKRKINSQETCRNWEIKTPKSNATFTLILVYLLLYLQVRPTVWLCFGDIGGVPVAQMVKRMPAMQETRVLSLGQEDPLQKGMATHFNILAWGIPWTEEPSGLWSWGHKELDTT